MFVRVICTQCKNVDWHDIDIRVFEYRIFREYEIAHRYLIDHIAVTDTLSDAEMKKRIEIELQDLRKDGIDDCELHNAIASYFGVSAKYSKELSDHLRGVWDSIP